MRQFTGVITDVIVYYLRHVEPIYEDDNDDNRDHDGDSDEIF